ncbi:MAG TPA: glycosyltransferase family 39 protein [Vicinamibacteria bacterium]|nr:glycosyltransferase family 39 protein [Vicinamibacteria bacterium]
MTPRRVLLVAVLAAGAALRVAGANSELWYDEIATVRRYVRSPPVAIASRYERVNNHVLTSLLSHASVRAFGEEPWAVRLPSILFGVATVAVFHTLAARFWPPPVALAAAALFALSPHHVHYTQNGRGYAAFLFFALLSTELLWRLAGEPSPRRARWYGWGYAFAVALGAYALLLMAFVAAGQAGALVATRRARLLPWLGLGALLTLLLYAPMLPAITAYYFEHRYPTGHGVASAELLRELRPVAPFLVLGAIAGPLLLVRMWRRERLGAALLAFPAAATVGLPALRGQGVHPRWFIFGLPVAYLLLAEALDWVRTRRPRAAMAAGAAVALLSGVALARYYVLPKQAFRQALAYVEAARAPGDERIGLGLAGRAARFYDPSVVLVDDAEELEAWRRSAHRRTWVVFTFPRQLRARHPRLLEWVQQATEERAAFPGVIDDGTVYVHVWEPAADAARPGSRWSPSTRSR